MLAFYKSVNEKNPQYHLVINHWNNNNENNNRHSFVSWWLQCQARIRCVLGSHSIFSVCFVLRWFWNDCCFAFSDAGGKAVKQVRFSWTKLFYILIMTILIRIDKGTTTNACIFASSCRNSSIVYYNWNNKCFSTHIVLFCCFSVLPCQQPIQLTTIANFLIVYLQLFV